jgi:phosphoenolpyruvate carboxykinase (GTP)
MGSEATAAAENQAAIRRDPFAMLPFCGYNMADHWNHWLAMEKTVKHLPRIFRTNWFRKDETGKFAWPGFGENMRVLQWIVDRIRDRAPEPVDSPFGLMPHYQDLNWQGLPFPKEKFEKLMNVPPDEARAEAEDQSQLFTRFGSRLPPELEQQRQNLLRRLSGLGHAAQ